MSNTTILLHGFTGQPASWDAVVRCLPPSTRVLRPALLGHDPRVRSEARTFDDEVDRLARGIEREGAQGAHLAGYSLGGRVALGLLARHGALFGSATLIGVHPGLPDEAERTERTARDEAWARLLEERGIDAFVDAWEAQPLFATQRGLPAEVREARRSVRRHHDPHGLARALRVLGLGVMPDRRTALAGLSMPVTLVAGERDTRFRTLADAMARLMPRGRVQVVPGAGHDVTLEAPAAVAAIVAGAMDVGATLAPERSVALRGGLDG